MKSDGERAVTYFQTKKMIQTDFDFFFSKVKKKSSSHLNVYHILSGPSYTTTPVCVHYVYKRVRKFEKVACLGY